MRQIWNKSHSIGRSCLKDLLESSATPVIQSICLPFALSLSLRDLSRTDESSFHWENLGWFSSRIDIMVSLKFELHKHQELHQSPTFSSSFNIPSFKIYLSRFSNTYWIRHVRRRQAWLMKLSLEWNPNWKSRCDVVRNLNSNGYM